MSMMKTSAAAAVAFSVMASAAQASILIDDFDVDQGPVSDTTDDGIAEESTYTDAPNAYVWESRTIGANLHSANDGGDSARIAIAFSKLAFESSARTTASGFLGYSFGTAGIDLTAGANAFLFSDVFADQVVSFDIEVTSASGASSFFGFEGPFINPLQDVTVAFSDFTGSADFTAVTSLAFLIGTNGTTDSQGVDFEISTVSAVPLPAAGFVLLTALGGAAAAYRRRKA